MRTRLEMLSALKGKWVYDGEGNIRNESSWPQENDRDKIASLGSSAALVDQTSAASSILLLGTGPPATEMQGTNFLEAKEGGLQ